MSTDAPADIPPPQTPDNSPSVREYLGTRFVYVIRLVAPHKGTFPAEVGHWACQRCGSNVNRWQLHAEWHAEMDRATGRVEGLGL